jgi:hypothetical protein
MLSHLPIIILTSLHPVVIADAVPQFDIVQECRGEGGTQETEQRCSKDEMHARDQFQTEWPQFDPGVKLQCLGETNIDGSASYVELLTCLEMERDVSTERETKTSK